MQDLLKFHKASKNERIMMTKFFQKNKITQFDFTSETGYDGEDGYFTGRTTTAVVFETKCRYLTSTKYPDTIIETKKVKSLLEKAKKNNHVPYIFFFFTDGTYLIQPIYHNVNYVSCWLECPETTMGNREMVWKEVIYFPIDKTKLHKFN